MREWEIVAADVRRRIPVLSGYGRNPVGRVGHVAPVRGTAHIRKRRARSDAPHLYPEVLHHGGGATGYVQLLVNFLHMRPHCFGTDAQLRTDFLIGKRRGKLA